MKILLASAISATLMISTASVAGDTNAAIEAAKASQKKAAAVGGQWRDTGKLIKKAEAAAKDGKKGKAAKLAATAENQGKLGYEQAMSQKDAGPRF